jgi:Nitronate monooxygenase
VLDAMTAETDGVLAVNFLTEDIDRDVLDVAARRVRLVDLFWSDPSPEIVARVHDAGALVSWQVGSVAEAQAARDAGCDIVIAQGLEAGGHVRGVTPLRELLPAVLDAVDLPVLAASRSMPAAVTILAAIQRSCCRSRFSSGAGGQTAVPEAFTTYHSDWTFSPVVSPGLVSAACR